MKGNGKEKRKRKKDMKMNKNEMEEKSSYSQMGESLPMISDSLPKNSELKNWAIKKDNEK